MMMRSPIVSAPTERNGLAHRGWVVDIDIEAFGGQRNLVELGALLFALSSRSLRLVLGFFSILFDARHRLNFPVAGCDCQGGKQDQDQHSFVAGCGITRSRIAGRPQRVASRDRENT